MGPIPSECNGLDLIDKDSNFSKLNCQWIKKNAGRPRIDKKITSKKKEKSKFRKPKTICITMEEDHLKFIKQQALHKSVSAGIYIEPNQLIRQALIEAFPMPQQFDMFGGKR